MCVIFKGVKPLDIGLKAVELPPIPMPGADIKKERIEGRDGFVTTNYGTFDGISIPVKFLFVGNDIMQTVEDAKALLQGTGDLIFENDLDHKYEATIINNFDIAISIFNFGEFTVIFDCQPYRKSTGVDAITVLTPTTVVNSTIYNAFPLIEIYAYGDIAVTVGAYNFAISNVQGYAAVDSEIMECYDNVSGFINNRMTGNFPILVPGQTGINYTGNINKIVINPNWRCI